MISLRLKQEDENLIKRYAEFCGVSISEFMRRSAIEKIEDEYDLKLAREYEEKKRKGELEFVEYDDVWSKIDEV